MSVSAMHSQVSHPHNDICLKKSCGTIVFQAFKCTFEEHYNGPVQNISAILFQLYTLQYLGKYLILDL